MSGEKTRWGGIGLLYLAGLSAAMHYAKLPAMLPELRAALRLSDVEAAFLFSAVGVVGALFGVAVAGLASAAGELKSVRTGLAASAVLALVSTQLGDWSGHMGVRVLEGFAHVSIVAVVPTLMLQLTAQRDRGLVLGIWGTYVTVTFMVVAFLTPWMIGSGGWTVVAVVHGVVCIAALFGLAVVRLPKPRAGRRPTLQGVVAAHIALYGTPRRAVIPALFFTFTMQFVATMGLLGAALSEVYGLSLVEAAHWLAILPAATILGALVGGTAQRKGLAPHKVIVLAFGVAVTGAVGAFVVAPPFVVGAGFQLLLFFGIGLMPSGVLGLIPVLAGDDPEAVTLVNGGVAQGGNLGNFVGAPILATFVAQAGLAGFALHVFLAATLAACLLIVVYRAVRDLVPAEQ
jgi:DHA1 family inner membrane transport protein